ncbi:MFS transporter [Brooklawnia cerclae]|uniref:CP family cyanate transporter-like MFS transporter n=1 Tax=Brooklawnia cerclae TaxID=349934 RepID=A0ABX0SC52_9ACTN|nr:MFS transporter [Brooklawnia cerclae]NIH55968.1 CP family cyanate transporter-like MFS transporter [Brooklawnia cerclae]
MPADTTGESRTTGDGSAPGQGGAVTGGLVPVLLVAACLRTPLSGVSPLVPRIGAQLGLSAPALGLLTTLPLLAFATVSPLAGWVSGRWGMGRTFTVFLSTLAVGILLRSAPGVGSLYTGTVLIGASIAFGNVLVPALIKRDYSASMSWLTGVYSAVMTGLAGVASGIAVPLSDALGQRWRPALAAALPLVVVALAVWIGRSRRLGETPLTVTRDDGSRGGRAAWAHLLRSPDAWAVAVFMGLQSTTFYMLLAWLPTIERNLGVSDAGAGAHLLVFQAVGVLAGLVVSRWMQQTTDHRVPAAVTGIAMVIGVAGLLARPQLLGLWIVITGLSQGSAIVVALALPGLRSQGPRQTARLAGMAQSLGYLMAAAGPTVAGWLGQSDGWDAVLIVVGALACVQAVVALPAGRHAG